MTRDPTALGAAELARSIGAGELSAVEVTEAYLRRIERVDPELNAVVVPLFDEARAAAERADAAHARGESLGPLHGVPVSVKEAFDVAGTPTTAGLPERASHRAAEDGPLVARLRRAGAVLLGKTNVPQLLLYNETDNPLYGRTRNPWSAERAPGGSSGGEAALLAAGGAALGLGTDIGGSIREPAHACGIHGLKPTSGRLTLTGTADSWLFAGQEGILPQPGPLGRRVADLALAMKVLVPVAGEPAEAAVPPVPFGDPAAVRLADLRVGVYTDDGFFPASPALRRAVEEGAAALAERGAKVGTFQPPEVGRAIDLYFALMSADAGAHVRGLLRRGRRDRRIAALLRLARLPGAVRPPLAGLLAAAGQGRLAALVRSVGGVSARRYWELVAERNRYRQRFLAALDAGGFDALLCPPHALPALTHGASFLLPRAASYAMLYNLLGMPAGVVAATRVGAGEESDRPGSHDRVERAARRVEAGSAGLPVGVQVAARPWREDVVLALMAALEEHFRGRSGYPGMPPLAG